MRIRLFFILGAFLFQFTLQAQQNKYLQVPGVDQFATINHSGISILPSGRYVKPAGKVSMITHDPFGLTISPDGKKVWPCTMG